MLKNKDFELPSFIGNVRESGNSLEVTIDARIVEFLGIKKGDLVKVIVKKIEKEE
jgi:antitoxin component of MazEF toxin-antitoxin module